MDPRYAKLLRERQALDAEAKELLAALDAADTPAEKIKAAQERFDKITAEGTGDLAEVNAKLDRWHRLHAQERGFNLPEGDDAPGTVARDPTEQVQAGGPSRIRVHDPALFRSLGEQLVAVARVDRGGDRDPRLDNVHAMWAASGASGAIPQDGGALVQPDFNTSLLMRAQEASQLYPLCDRIPVAGSGLDAPYIDETSRATGSRWGGVQIYRNHEADSVTAKKPKFGKHRLELEDLSGLAYATDNLLQDAPALGGMFENAFRSEYAWVLDNEILNGTGAGEMLGILNADCTVSVAKATGQAAATVVFENIVAMEEALWTRSLGNYVWLANQFLKSQLYQMSMPVGTGGVPVYMPAGGISGAQYGTLFGRPVLYIEQAAQKGSVGDIVAADFSQYVIIEKGGIEGAQSIHVRFINHETAFRWKTRNNGQPKWASALTVADGSGNTVSPFVTLAARA